MANTSVAVHTVNVQMHPHSPELYGALLERSRGGVPVQYYGALHGIVGFASRAESGLVHGEVFTFVDFDTSQQWLDVRNRTPQEHHEVENLIQSMGDKRPGLKRYKFVFDPVEHKMLLDATLSARHVERILGSLFNQDEVLRGLSDAPIEMVEVTVQQSKEALQEILALAELREIVITVIRPNSDRVESLEGDVSEHMRKEGVYRRTTVLSTGRRGSGLKLQPKTIEEAELALKSGSIYARGRELPGARVLPYSTKSRPDVFAIEYDTEVERTPEAAMDRFARDAWRGKTG